MRVFFFSFLSLGFLGADEPEQKDRFQLWDQNSDGKLSRAELPPGLKKNFAKVDRDGDGFISRAEHERAMAAWRQARGREGGGRRPGGNVRLPDGVKIQRDLDYVGARNSRQTLDLLQPAKGGSKPRPLIVFVHGGGWKSGSKERGIARLVPYVKSGEYVGATINYRLTGEAPWPAQIYDCKAAIRFLRGKAKEFGIDPEKIAVWGTSAGGHLVSMLGTSGGVAELEGDLGDDDGQSSRVTCVVNFFGPSNFLTMVAQKSSVDRSPKRKYPEALLLGGPVQDLEQAARQASPVTWISKDDPPFFTAHGTKDPVVPYAQGEEIHRKLKEAGLNSLLVPVEGAGHGFNDPQVDQKLKAFFDQHLGRKEIDEPVESEPEVKGK